MPIALYFDVHVDHAILAQLRLREVDVLTAQEDGTDRLTDERLLERASELGRPIFTHDIRFKAMAENWQSQARPLLRPHLRAPDAGVDWSMRKGLGTDRKSH